MRRKLLAIPLGFILTITSLLLPEIIMPVHVMALTGESGQIKSEQLPASGYNRQSPYSGTEKGTLDWVYSANKKSTTTPVVAADGTVYFTTDNDLYAIDRTGKMLWTWNNKDAAVKLSSPQISSSGIIYCTSSDGKLHAIDNKGKEIWEYNPNITDGSSYTCTGCTVDRDGTIYYSTGVTKQNLFSQSDYIKLYAISPSGTLKWCSNTNAVSCNISDAPVLNNNGIIFIRYLYHRTEFLSRVGFSNTYKVCIDVFDLTGKLVWEQSIPSNSQHYSQLTINGDDGVYVAVDNKLYSIDSTGQTKYTCECIDIFSSDNGAAQSVNGNCVFSAGNTVYCANPDGSIQWKFSADSNVNCIPLTDKIGCTYITSNEGSLYCIDNSGKQKWKTLLTGKVYGSSPVIRSDGIIYQLTYNGDLSAVGKMKVKSMQLNAHEVTLLDRGMKAILRPVYYPEDAKEKLVKWSSSNTSVATVKDGVITPVSAGKTVITVISEEDKLSDSCTVTVLSKPSTDMTLSCDTVLSWNGSSHEGIFSFQNLTLGDGIIVTSEGISEIELIVKGTLKIGKNASIRVRNGYYSNVPEASIAALSLESLKKMMTLRSGNVISLPQLYGKGGNGGNGGNGSYDLKKVAYNNDLNISKYCSNNTAGGGGGAGGYGGGSGGFGGANCTGGGTYSYIPAPSRYRSLAGTGTDGSNNGENGGNVTDAELIGISDPAVTISGGLGGGARNIGKMGLTGKLLTDGGSGGGGNGGNGGFALYKDYFAGGGGGGGGGYGGGVLGIAASTINVQTDSTIPCFITSGQQGGKGGYPNGTNGENGEGGLLIIESNSYKPASSHWNVGSATINCDNPDINGGHGTVTGNPQKVFINGIDVSGYTDVSLKSLNMADRSSAFIKIIGK